MQGNLLSKTGFERRSDEIDFCLLIEKILIAYNRNVIVLDLLGIFSALADVTPTLINKLIQQVYIQDRSVVPSKEELLLILNKRNFSMRQIKKLTGIHPNTQYRLIKEMKNNNNRIPDIKPRFNDEEYIAMYKFMEQVNKFKEI